MGKITDTNKELIEKYKVDNTIIQSYFKNSKNVNVTNATFPLRIDNRQYCSPTDYQGDLPACCAYSAAQILEALCWKRTGNLMQFDASQIYAKAKETDKQVHKAGTYPDLTMMKGLDLLPNGNNLYEVKSSTSSDINELKRVLHKNMFVCVNMMVCDDLYKLDANNFIYTACG